MRILLIAPKNKSLDQVFEIKELTSQHRTTVLNGDITIQDIFDEVRNSEYDIVHFATDLTTSNNDEMYISDRESLNMSDTENILKLSKARLAFFNFCSSARFATYVTNRSIECAIYTTTYLDEKVAWRFPLAFYEQLKRKEAADLLSFNEIYESTAPGDGSYGWAAGIKYYRSFFETLRLMIIELEAKITILSKLVSEHSSLLGGGDLANKIENKYVIIGVVLLALLIVISSGITIWSNIADLIPK
jgi:hypothetical protein